MKPHGFLLVGFVALSNVVRSKSEGGVAPCVPRYFGQFAKIASCHLGGIAGFHASEEGQHVSV